VEKKDVGRKFLHITHNKSLEEEKKINGGAVDDKNVKN
jgi:hypothetical protein